MVGLLLMILLLVSFLIIGINVYISGKRKAIEKSLNHIKIKKAMDYGLDETVFFRDKLFYEMTIRHRKILLRIQRNYGGINNKLTIKKKQEYGI